MLTVGVPAGMTAHLDFAAADVVVGSLVDLGLDRLDELLLRVA